MPRVSTVPRYRGLAFHGKGGNGAPLSYLVLKPMPLAGGWLLGDAEPANYLPSRSLLRG
jgi:hypothetical protein